MFTIKKQNYFPVFVICIIILLFVISFITFWYQARINNDLIIAEDVAVLSKIFKSIDEDCRILNFKYEQQNYVDFLNVITFEGSELGSMTLERPEKWKGPYLRDNLTVQGKHYQIVKGLKGYYIAPGNGVKLNNNKIIGVDIILNPHQNIELMIQKNGVLNFNGKSLALPCCFAAYGEQKNSTTSLQAYEME